MKNRVRFFRKAKHWTQADVTARVGVNRECIDAIEKGRFLPSIALAYNIAAAFEGYVYDVFPPQSPTPPVAPIVQLQPAASRDSSFHSGGLK